MSTTNRSPRLGYALAATAATLWALNGSLLAVIGAVVWVRRQRQVVDAELAPAFGTRRRRRAARPAPRPATHVE